MTAPQIAVAAMVAFVVMWWFTHALPRIREQERNMRAQGRCVSCGSKLPDGWRDDECRKCGVGGQG